MEQSNGGTVTQTKASDVLIQAPQKLPKGHRGPKSKTGCVVCKGRRIKCDETRPSCDQCRKKSLDCVFLPPKVTGRARKHSALTRDDIVMHTPESSSHESSESATLEPRELSVSTPISEKHFSHFRFGLKAIEPKQQLDFSTSSTAALTSPQSTSVPISGENGWLLDKGSRTEARGSAISNVVVESDEDAFLTNIFFQTSTHLFSIYTGECNPFMRLRQYLPDSKALRLAVQAMAALSVAGHQTGGHSPRMDQGLELQRLAYRQLSFALTDPVVSLSDSTFAAIVHIGMTEPWHSLRSDQSGAMHLRTSKVLICQRHMSNVDLPPRYLCNLLLYWDLLVSLHSESAHEGYTTEMLFQGNHSEEQPIDYIDPTTGVAQGLFKDIIEMENFLRHRRAHMLAGLSAEPYQMEAAISIEHRLKTWQPKLDAQKLLGCLAVFETTSLQDILFTAEAYRQTALLLLYRSFPALVTSAQPQLRQSATYIVKLLSAISPSSPVCTTHEWILFVTAPDISSQMERAFVRERMGGLLEKIGIIGIKEALDYIESTWAMIDSGGSSAAWMDEMHQRNWLPLLG